MTVAATGVDYKSAPSDYAALFKTYFPYMVNLVSRNGIDDNNKEDVASDILKHFIDTDIINQFNPDLVFEYEGTPRPARFKSFLSRKVFNYCKGYRDKQKRLAAREIQICDIHLSEDESSAGHKTRGVGSVTAGSWADVYGPPNPDHAHHVIELVGEEQDAQRLRAWLYGQPRRSSHDRCDLVELFDAVRKQVLATGEYNIAELQEIFDLSTTTMHTWVWWLKSNVAQYYGRPSPPKRARTLGTVDS